MKQPNLVEIFGSYTSWKIDDNTWVINFMNGSQNIYLLEGKEKALLIDTGWGVGNLRQYVAKLTDKPILVVNTHYHPDHAGGNGEFEEVYMSEGEKIDATSLEGMLPCDISKLPNPNYKKIYLKDGETIELGERSVKIIEALSAHCNSSLFLFDEEHGMFFCGDELEAGQILLFDNSNNPDAPYDVKKRLDNFKKNNDNIKQIGNKIKFLLPNHNGYPISLSYVDDAIELVNHIYAGDAVIEDKLNHPFIEKEDPKAPELCRVRWNNVSIFIKKKDVMSVYGM